MVDHSSQHNRRTVVVEQEMVKAPTLVQNPRNSQSKGPSLSLVSSVVDPGGTHKLHSTTEAFNTSHIAKQSTTDLPAILSSPESVNSSFSSLVDTVSCARGAMPPSSDNTIFEYLQGQISQSAMKICQLEKEAKDIPKFQLEIDKLEKERIKLANSMLDSQELIETMKLRISVLHEQNEQLAQLTVATKSESSEVVKMRNTLVASLTQLKQLQKQVDTIPGLKVQIRMLADENTQLKEADSKIVKKTSVKLTESDEHQALLRDNEELRQANMKYLQRLSALNEQVGTITVAFDELKEVIEANSKSKPVVQLLQEQIDSLESEKDSLCDQIVELKLHGGGFVDVDTAYLATKTSELMKENSHLKSCLEQQKIESRLQKEQLILKLLNVEHLKVRSQKYELEGHVLEIHGYDETECKVVSQEGLHERSSWPESLPIVKQQLLKLHQFEVHYEQLCQHVQTLTTEKEELEKRAHYLTTKLEKDNIVELESQLAKRETKLKIAHKRIDHLEQQLSSLPKTNSDVTTLVSENAKLTQQLTELQEIYQQSLDVIRDLKKIEEQQSQYETLQYSLRKAKDDKHKAEKRYKNVSDRLQSLAQELSSSVELLNNYQTQCAQLRKDLESALEENSCIRKEAAILKADLVHRSNDVQELQLSSERMRKEKDDNERTILEFQQQLEAMMNEKSVLKDEANILLETKTHELEMKTVECETNLIKLEVLLGSSSDSKRQLCVELEALRNDYDQSFREVAGLQVKIEDVNHQLENVLMRNLAEYKEARKDENVAHMITKERLQKSAELVLELQENNKSLHQKTQSQNSEMEKIMQALTARESEVESLHAESKAASLVASTEIERLVNLLKQNEAHTKVCIASLNQEKAELLSKLEHNESQIMQLESNVQEVNDKLKVLQNVHESEKNEADKLRQQFLTLSGEVEGYKAIVESLQHRLEEAETREIEHEVLRSKIKKLERLHGHSTHDNETLVKLLHEIVSELPTSTTEVTRSLQDENLKLEEQVSVLSQWNDKQRQEIEDLENQNHILYKEKHQLLLDLTTKDSHMQENLQLKRELKEVEMEINTLRRQARADVHEELQMKIETQTQLLSVFSQHNDSLQMQVEQLQEKVLVLGGKLDKKTPVSPPPMPDMSTLTMQSSEEIRQRTWSDLGRENLILKQRINTMEKEVRKLHNISSAVRRRSSTLHALSSIPVGTIHEELQIK